MTDKEMDCVLVNAVDKEGFVWSFTLRADDENELFTKMENVRLKFEKQNFSPSGRPSFVSKPATKVTNKTKMCEIHNIEMEEKISKAGKPYYSHYDPNEGICFGAGYKGKSY